MKNGILIPVGLVGAIVTIGVIGFQSAYKYGQLNSVVGATQEKVEKVEVKAEDNKDNIQELASTINEYIAVQSVKEEGDRKREALLIDLIREIRKE